MLELTPELESLAQGLVENIKGQQRKSEEDIRYYQGAVDGINLIINQIVELSRKPEKSDERKDNTTSLQEKRKSKGKESVSK